MKYELEIHPGQGLGPVRIGITTEQVHSLLGDPIKKAAGVFAEKVEWEYVALTCGFREVGGELRVSSIRSSSATFGIGGEELSGLHSTEAIKVCASHGLGKANVSQLSNEWPDFLLLFDHGVTLYCYSSTVNEVEVSDYEL